MLSWLRVEHGASDRKLRLFACALMRLRARHFWALLRVPVLRAVDDAERLADRGGSIPQPWGIYWTVKSPTGAEAASSVIGMLGMGGKPDHGPTAQAELLREVFGNPFRPVTVDPASLAWNAGTVPRLAKVIYNERAFDRLPILADALEDAGCTDEQILSHCRGPGPHVRGCWVVDLLLAKS
jgi:hypothetical protein